MAYGEGRGKEDLEPAPIPFKTLISVWRSHSCPEEQCVARRRGLLPSASVCRTGSWRNRGRGLDSSWYHATWLTCWEVARIVYEEPETFFPGICVYWRHEGAQRRAMGFRGHRALGFLPRWEAL